MTIQKIYRVALGNRGGEFEDLLLENELSNEIFKLADYIKNLVEYLAAFLKERELQGFARIFFKNSRIVLELILYRCKIDITYYLLNETVSTQVIINGDSYFTISFPLGDLVHYLSMSKKNKLRLNDLLSNQFKS